VGASYADARSSIEEDFPDVSDVVAVLATTTEIPNDSVSFYKDFPAEMREQVVNALLEISGSEEGQAALEALYSIAALVKADDTFYDGFRADLSKAGIDVESLVE
jgi:phosphonate transport system substrate-binding protein